VQEDLMRVTDDSLRGRTVISAEGHAIGEVVSMFIDASAWRVDALVVEVRRTAAERLGVRHGFLRHATIEIPIQQVQSAGDAVVLGVPIEQLRIEPVTSEPAESAPLH
jgi:sporulation protein YlmC with PRC-barrel domain